MSQEIASLHAKIGANVSGLQRGLTDVNRMLHSTTANVANAGKGIMGMLGSLGMASLGVGALSKTASSLADIFGVGLNSAMEDVDAQLRAFTKDGAVAKGILQQIRAEADKTPFAFDEMAKATAGLMPAARQSGAALMDLVKDAEILAASNPAQGLEGAAFALREAVSGDFTSVIERFNLPRSMINKLKEEGLPALEVVRKAMKSVGYDMDLVSNLALTGRGRWSTFMDTLSGIRRTVGEGLFEALKNDLADIQTWFDNNKDAINAWAQSAGQSVANAANNIRTTLSDLGTAWANMSDQSKRGLATIALLLVAGGPVLSGIVGLAKAVWVVGKAFDSLALKAIAALGAAAAVGSALEAAMYAATYGADKFLDRFKSNMAEVGNSVSKMGTSLAETLMPGNEMSKIAGKISEIKSALHNMEAGELTAQANLRRAQAETFKAREELQIHTYAADRDLYVEIVSQKQAAEDVLARRVEGLAEARAGMTKRQGELEGQVGMAAVDAVGQTEISVQNALARTFGLAQQYTLTLVEQANVARAIIEGAQASDVSLPFTKIAPPPPVWNPGPGVGGSGSGGGDKAEKKAKDYGASLQEIADAYALIDKRATDAAAAVAEWQARIDMTTLAQTANNDQMKAAQDELARMGQRVAELNMRLTEAKQRLSDFGNVRLPGMQGWEDQLFSLDQQIKKLELSKLMGGGASIDRQIEALRQQRDILQKQGELRFDPGMRQLQAALQGTRPEIPLEQALAGIGQAQRDVAGYTAQVAQAEAAQKAQERVVAALQATAETLNRTLAEQQVQLRIQEDRQARVNDVLKAAYTWFLNDRDAMIKSGKAGTETAAAVDKATRAMMGSLDAYLADASNQSINQLNAIWDAYQRRRAEAYTQLGAAQGLSTGGIGGGQSLSKRFGANYAEWVANGGSGSEAGFAEHLQNLQQIGAFPGDIKIMDSGGIATGPTLAALAMNGRPEAVIPLGSGRGGYDSGIDYTRLARAIVDAIGSGGLRIDMDGRTLARLIRPYTAGTVVL